MQLLVFYLIKLQSVVMPCVCSPVKEEGKINSLYGFLKINWFSDWDYY